MSTRTTYRVVTYLVRVLIKKVWNETSEWGQTTLPDPAAPPVLQLCLQNPHLIGFIICSFSVSNISHSWLWQISWLKPVTHTACFTGTGMKKPRCEDFVYLFKKHIHNKSRLRFKATFYPSLILMKMFAEFRIDWCRCIRWVFREWFISLKVVEAWRQ